MPLFSSEEVDHGSALAILCGGAVSGDGVWRGNEPAVDLKQPAAGQVGDWILGEPIQSANLTVFPLLSREPRSEDRFITLDEGIKQGTIEIVEVVAPWPSPPSRQFPVAPVQAIPSAAIPISLLRFLAGWESSQLPDGGQQVGPAVPDMLPPDYISAVRVDRRRSWRQVIDQSVKYFEESIRTPS